MAQPGLWYNDIHPLQFNLQYSNLKKLNMLILGDGNCQSQLNKNECQNKWDFRTECSWMFSLSQEAISWDWRSLFPWIPLADTGPAGWNPSELPKTLFSVPSSLHIIVILILIVTKQKVLWWYPQQWARGPTVYFKEFKEITQSCCIKSFYMIPIHIDIQVLHTPHIIWFHNAS